MRNELLDSHTGRFPEAARTGSLRASGAAMIEAMELPREDLLRYRRRGDYQRYAAGICGVRVEDDPFVNLTARRKLRKPLKELGAIGGHDPNTPRNWVSQRLVNHLSRTEVDPKRLAAEVLEIAHLRDLLSAIDLKKGPPLGDQPPKRGSSALRLITVGAYDLILLDGVVGWIADDPGVREDQSDVDVKGDPSEIIVKALQRGFRLSELRQLLEDDDGDGRNQLGRLKKNPETGRSYIYAKNGTEKMKVLARVCNLAEWSPMRRLFATDPVLMGKADDFRQNRPYDIWTREKLREHWRHLNVQAVVMHDEGCDVSQIALALSVHEETIRQWLEAASLQRRLRREANEMHDAGTDSTEISLKLRVSRQTIERWLSK